MAVTAAGAAVAVDVVEAVVSHQLLLLGECLSSNALAGYSGSNSMPVGNRRW